MQMSVASQQSQVILKYFSTQLRMDAHGFQQLA